MIRAIDSERNTLTATRGDPGHLALGLRRTCSCLRRRSSSSFVALVATSSPTMLISADSRRENCARAVGCGCEAVNALMA